MRLKLGAQVSRPHTLMPTQRRAACPTEPGSCSLDDSPKDSSSKSWRQDTVRGGPEALWAQCPVMQAHYVQGNHSAGCTC